MHKPTYGFIKLLLLNVETAFCHGLFQGYVRKSFLNLRQNGEEVV